MGTVIRRLLIKTNNTKKAMNWRSSRVFSSSYEVNRITYKKNISVDPTNGMAPTILLEGLRSLFHLYQLMLNTIFNISLTSLLLKSMKLWLWCLLNLWRKHEKWRSLLRHYIKYLIKPHRNLYRDFKYILSLRKTCLTTNVVLWYFNYWLLIISWIFNYSWFSRNFRLRTGIRSIIPLRKRWD